MHESTPAQALRLGAFQDAFARALLAPDPPFAGGIEALRRQPGFVVYRNTVLKGCIDALEANYPAVLRLVGADCFRATAAAFVRSNLPRHPSLALYGDGFAAFLADFEAVAALPYLPGVARLDRFWTEAHTGPDETPVEAAAVARLAPRELEHARLRPHRSARWAWFEAHPVYTIWRSNREPDVARAPDVSWHAEGALVVGSRGAVTWMALDAAGCAFMDACAAGAALGAAAHAALATAAGVDLSRLMARLLQAGAFGSLAAPSPSPGETHA